MSYLRQVELDSSFPPFAAFREHFGFVPNLFRAQSLLPGVIEAEAGIAASVLIREQALSRIRKERILLALAAANRNAYCVTAHYQMLSLLGVPEKRLNEIISDYRQAGLSPADKALLYFALKLGRYSPSVSRKDFTPLLAHGWDDESMLEAVLVTALANFLCTLSTGVGAVPDFEPRQIPTDVLSSPGMYPSNGAEESSGPYLKAIQRSPDEFAPFAFFREKFGFIPNIFRAQTLRPDVVEAEASAIREVLLTEQFLTRVQKESILLVISAANLNTYCVAVHCEMLRAMGISMEDSDQIAVDHRQARLAESDKALLDFALKLTVQPSRFCREGLEPLRKHGFTDEQILETLVMTSFTNFLNTLQMGLGVTPDFPPRLILRPTPSKVANLLDNNRHPIEIDLQADPDTEPVARVQGGDLDAFEDLINRHSRRVYRTLVGILGNPDEARDAMQDTFLKAFQHLGDFQGRSKFSTWLVSIASNTGLQLLRDRKHVQSLHDDAVETDEGFRPQQIRAWSDDPEQLYSKSEVRTLVEDHVMKLPAKYRVVLVLRDIEQLSIEESAAALGLGIPALKSRHLRGRLMLREALTPHFTVAAKGEPA